MFWWGAPDSKAPACPAPSFVLVRSLEPEHSAVGWPSLVYGAGLENLLGSNPLASSNLAPTAECSASPCLRQTSHPAVFIAYPMDYLTAHPFIAFAIAGAIVAFSLGGFILDLRRRWNAVFGQKAKAGTEVMQAALRRLLTVEHDLAAYQPRLEALEAAAPSAIQKVGFKRFNPFEHTGGDQSFSLALLDHKDDGVIISSLYTRDGVRVYAKEIKRGSSKHPLSDEEREVLEQALSAGKTRYHGNGSQT